MQHRSTTKLFRPGGGGFHALSSLTAPQTLMAYRPQFMEECDASRPRRKNMVAPQDQHTFVKPIKQAFVKNPRTMPMTRIMLTLLAGWAGQGGQIETTVGIVGRHIGRCRRQVFRYLKDAMEEGYLTYTRTKDRIGRYTGIRIRLNFAAIRYVKSQRPRPEKTAATLEVTLKSETKGKYIYNGRIDGEISAALERMAASIGFEMPCASPG